MSPVRLAFDAAILLTFEGAAIHRARILVEGKIVAEAEGGRGRGLADPIRLTARVSEVPQGSRP